MDAKQRAQKKLDYDFPVRQDVYVCFTSDKDFMHTDSIIEKACPFTGIAIRVKTTVTAKMMKNILDAIDKDYLDSLDKLETAKIFEKTPPEFVDEVM